jgi:Flp pilus assembly pilin Flp
VIAFRTPEIARQSRRAQEVVMAMMLVTRFRQFVRESSGQDLIEYALLAALIALVSVVAIRTAGTEVLRIFNSIVAQLQTA